MQIVKNVAWSTVNKPIVFTSCQGQFNVHVHHGPGRTLRMKDLEAHDIVITSYDIIRAEARKDNRGPSVRAHWYRIVLDGKLESGGWER